jgi:hypothetical protein
MRTRVFTLALVLALLLALVITPCYAVRTQKYTAVQAGYGGLTAHGGPLLVEQIDGDDLFKVTAATGVVTYTPTTTTATAWTATLTALTEGIGVLLDGHAAVTSGTLLQMKLDSDVFTTGSFINCLGGASYNTSVFKVTGAGNTTVGGTLGVTGATTLTGAATFSSTVAGPGAGKVIYNKYARITVSAINTAAATGVELLPAVTGRQYRIVNATITAYGGAMTSTNATSLEIVSDPAGTPVVLYQVLKAQLARGTTAGVGMNTMNPATASTVLLADNASFVAQVANKPIYLITTGSSVDWATATGVDVSISYVVE